MGHAKEHKGNTTEVAIPKFGDEVEDSGVLKALKRFEGNPKGMQWNTKEIQRKLQFPNLQTRLKIRVF